MANRRSLSLYGPENIPANGLPQQAPPNLHQQTLRLQAMRKSLSARHSTDTESDDRPSRSSFGSRRVVHPMEEVPETEQLDLASLMEAELRSSLVRAANQSGENALGTISSQQTLASTGSVTLGLVKASSLARGQVDTLPSPLMLQSRNQSMRHSPTSTSSPPATLSRVGSQAHHASAPLMKVPSFTDDDRLSKARKLDALQKQV